MLTPLFLRPRQTIHSLTLPTLVSCNNLKNESSNSWGVRMQTSHYFLYLEVGNSIFRIKELFNIKLRPIERHIRVLFHATREAYIIRDVKRGEGTGGISPFGL